MCTEIRDNISLRLGTAYLPAISRRVSSSVYNNDVLQYYVQPAVCGAQVFVVSQYYNIIYAYYIHYIIYMHIATV